MSLIVQHLYIMFQGNPTCIGIMGRENGEILGMRHQD